MPRVRIHVQFQSSSDSMEAKAPCYRVLIADDHAVARRGLRASLASIADVELCGEARTGREALDLAMQLKPDLVILDLSLRGINGVEVVQAIRSTLPETEVLIVSLHDSPDIACLALRAGARGYMTKADSHEELVSAVWSVRKRKLHVSRKLAAKLRSEAKRLLSRDASPDHTLTPEKIAAVLTRSELRIDREVRAMVRAG